jgi:hypothetical protein
MEQGPFQKPNSQSVSQDIPLLLGNFKDDYHAHMSLPLDLILSQMNPMHILTSYLLKIHFNIILQCITKSLKWFPPFPFSD